MTRRTSQLSGAEIASLEVTHFIFHIIDPAEDSTVEYLDETIQLSPRQYDFFLDRLREAARGTQFTFDDDSELKAKVERLIARPNTAFVEATQDIAKWFAQFHVGRRTSPGVVVFALARIAIDRTQHRRLLFLLKLDHRPVLQYTLSSASGKRVAAIAEVTNALVEAKEAVQKSALVDISDHFAWDVLASERSETGPGEITRYFRTFLGARELEQPSVLTRRAIQSVSRWARKLDPDQKPDDEDTASYRERAVSYMSGATRFDTDDFIAAVVRDHEQARRSRAMDTLREELATQGVAGQTFSPKPDSVSSAIKRTILKTREGVTIQYEGNRENVGVIVEDDPDYAGHKRIIIRTTGISDQNPT